MKNFDETVVQCEQLRDLSGIITERTSAFTEKIMPEYRKWITSNPDILFGKPAIKGTRIAVEQILDELAGGTTIDELLEAYPRLNRDAILATLAFAADTLRAEVTYPLDRAAS